MYCVYLQAFGCIDQDRDGVIKKQDLRETYGQLGILIVSLYKMCVCACVCVYVDLCFCVPGKLNVKDEELDEMLNEGKGPINFTVFLTLFGEKLNGKKTPSLCFSILLLYASLVSVHVNGTITLPLQAQTPRTPSSLPSSSSTQTAQVSSTRMSQYHLNLYTDCQNIQ